MVENVRADFGFIGIHDRQYSVIFTAGTSGNGVIVHSMGEKIRTQTRRQVAAFMRRYRLDGIRLRRDTGDQAGIPVCDVVLRFADKDKADKDAAAAVFRLWREQADFYGILAALEAGAEPVITLGPRAEALTEEEINRRIPAFLDTIEKRVAQVDREEKIQRIVFQGNRFIINNSIVIRVIHDDGEGKLDIEIVKGKEKQQAGMRTNDLMDGLYLGTIKELPHEAAAPH